MIVKTLKKNLEVFSHLFESYEDVMFGYIISIPRWVLLYYSMGMFSKVPSYEERQEAIMIGLDRASEIRLKISKVLK